MLSIYKNHHCQHRSDDFPVIAEILTPHKPLVVIELGTDEGGFSGWMADLVLPWGGIVHTFDIKKKFKEELTHDFKNLLFTEADVLSSTHDVVKTLASSPHVLLYCDNGNKELEVKFYAEYLKPGSILGVHDYNTEIMAEWVEPYVAKLGFERLGHAKMEALRNEWYTEPMTRFWIRKGTP